MLSRLRRCCPVLFCGLLLAGMVCLCVPGASAQTDAGLEYEVKAAFLYNFIKFVDWPPDEFATAESPIRVGLFGGDPFDGKFEEAVRSRKVWNRPIVVEEVDSVAAAADMQMLFVVAGEEERLSGSLAGLHAAGVVTVGETPAFEDLGGVITFTLEGGRVRFIINRKAAAATDVQFRAQLLQLALPRARP